VGTLEPRKNHVRLIGAFERLRRSGFPGPLVLVGRGGWKNRPILRRIETSPDAASIVRITDADDEDLAALYGACTACAYPSIEEGFGMPVLESMACGTPCVISDHPALVELARDCAVAVPHDDEDALARELARFWSDEDHRRQITAMGPTRAGAYAFPIWARQLFALYEREVQLAASPASNLPAA
jgi:glycosyltransferase involved in cell wall biosynthesis